MFKRIMFIVLTASLVLALSACTISVVTGSGKSITQQRNVSGFSQVVFAGLGEMAVVQGSTEGLKIEAEDNIMTRIKSEVKNGVLTIGFDSKDWKDMINPTRTIKYTLSVKNLTGLELTGAGNAVIETLNCNNLSLKITGAGGIKITKLEAASLVTTLSGAGGLELGGKATKQEVTLSGVGNYGAGNLESQIAKITLNGAGGATIWAKDSIDVTITGAGSIGYYGTPKIVKTITGVGVLNSLGNK